VRLPGGVCLTEITREPHRGVCVYWEAPRALLGLPPALLTRRRVDLNRVATQLGQLSHPHPQNSRYTPRCPSVVLWTPCSGVWWRVFEPTIRVWRSGTTRKQAANTGV
jgi:hypothetical protein